MSDPVTCPHCGASSLEVKARGGPGKLPLLASDTQIIGNACARRTLCRQCACLGVTFDPPDTLERFYARDYDIGPEIQNHPIVIQGKVMPKHDHVTRSLFSSLEGLPPKGRFLEIACGRGDLSRAFQAMHPDCECLAVDPSDEARAAFESSPSDVTFVHGFFTPETLGGQVFDLVVAHGLLNRVAPLRTLLDIRAISRPGTLLSLDLMLLEQSECAPFIWDHTFMYGLDALTAYLAHAGFEIDKVVDSASCTHIMCRCTGSALGEPDDISLPNGLFKRTEDLLEAHHGFWRAAAAAARKRLTAGGPYAIFGAGMYSAVLLTITDTHGIGHVIDETKAGSEFFGLPVVPLEEAGLPVLLCARPAYMNAIEATLRGRGVPCHHLIPAVADP